MKIIIILARQHLFTKGAKGMEIQNPGLMELQAAKQQVYVRPVFLIVGMSAATDANAVHHPERGKWVTSMRSLASKQR